MRLILPLIFVVTYSACAHAAEITIVEDPGSHASALYSAPEHSHSHVAAFLNGFDVAILIGGDLDELSADAFLRASLGVSSDRETVVILNSKGGYLKQAIDIGRTIIVSSMSTAVLPGGECSSACVVPLFSGSKRFDRGPFSREQPEKSIYIFEDASVKIHQPQFALGENEALSLSELPSSVLLQKMHSLNAAEMVEMYDFIVNKAQNSRLLEFILDSPAAGNEFNELDSFGEFYINGANFVRLSQFSNARIRDYLNDQTVLSFCALPLIRDGVKLVASGGITESPLYGKLSGYPDIFVVKYEGTDRFCFLTINSELQYRLDWESSSAPREYIHLCHNDFRLISSSFPRRDYPRSNVEALLGQLFSDMDKGAPRPPFSPGELTPSQITELLNRMNLLVWRATFGENCQIETLFDLSDFLVFSRHMSTNLAGYCDYTLYGLCERGETLPKAEGYGLGYVDAIRIWLEGGTWNFPDTFYVE